MKTEWISRAECARRLNVTRTMVTRYSRQGLPGNDAGMVSWPEAKEWAANRAASRTPQRKPCRHEPHEGAGSVSAREILDAIVENCGELPALLAAAGVRDAAFLRIAPEIFASCVFRFAGKTADALYPDLDHPEPGSATVPLAALMRRHGIAGDPADIATRAETMLAKFDKIIEGR